MAALGDVNGTYCDAQQYQQSLLSSQSRSPSITCLTRGDAIGLVVDAEASLLSCICLIAIFIGIGWNVRWYRKKYPDPDSNWKLFNAPADIYMFSLFVFDLLQATGGALHVKWVHDGIVRTGHFCTAQGVVQQTGELGVALITLLLAVHTFASAVFRVGLGARIVASGLVCLTCVFIVLWVAIGAGIHKNYETPTPYWCWISPRFPGDRLGGEYVWLWIALFGSAIVYIPLYFWMEGYWSTGTKAEDAGEKADEGADERADEGADEGADESVDERAQYARRRAALGMLLYPVAYTIVVLPTTFTRWFQFSHHHVPSAATYFGSTLFHLSGAINVALFLIARPGLLLFYRPKEVDEQETPLTRQSPAPQPPPQDDGPENSPDTAKSLHSSEPTWATLGPDGSTRNSALSN